MNNPPSSRFTLAILCALSVGLAPVALAEDEKIPELKTADGKVFQNVTITKVEPDAIRIMHEAGAAKIQFEMIPEELRKKFNMSSESVDLYREKIREQQVKQQRDAKERDLIVKKMISLDGTVLQVLETGVLLSEASFMKVGIEGEKRTKMPVSPVFVECDSSKYVDGDSFDEYVFYDGNFIYESVSGAKKTVGAFTTNREKFLKKSGLGDNAESGGK
jgi:hypothetical protein